MRRLTLSCCVAVLLAWVTPAWTGATPLADDERAQLAAQRQQIEARAEQAMAACASRFDVVGCQDATRRERSAALAPLQRREIELADQERKERAEAQQLRVRDKQRDAALRDAQQQMAPPVAAALAASAPPVRPTRRAGGPEAAAAELARKQQAQRAAERAESQRLRSQQQRQQIEQRQAEKARNERKPAGPSEGKPPAAGLPLPSAAALAALRASAAASSAPRP